MILKEEEFQEWLQHPITVAFKRALFRNREEIKEGLVSDAFDKPGEARGMAKAIEKILVMDYTDLVDSTKGE